MVKDATSTKSTPITTTTTTPTNLDEGGSRGQRVVLENPATIRMPIGETGPVGSRNQNAQALLQARLKGGRGRRQKALKLENPKPNRLMMGAFTAAWDDLSGLVARFQQGGSLA